jgi:hypothetical protein
MTVGLPFSYRGSQTNRSVKLFLATGAVAAPAANRSHSQPPPQPTASSTNRCCRRLETHAPGEEAGTLRDSTNHVVAHSELLLLQEERDRRRFGPLRSADSCVAGVDERGAEGPNLVAGDVYSFFFLRVPLILGNTVPGLARNSPTSTRFFPCLEGHWG